MNKPSFRRFVAVGDSQTEGVGDPYPDGTERGWADRFARSLNERDPGLMYANLAIRGRRIAEVHEEQLEPALALKPDLVSLIAGLNDMIRPGFDLDETIAHMDMMQAAFRRTGATVLTITYPDPEGLAPIGRLLRDKTFEFNRALREVAGRNGVLLLDLETTPISSEPRIWCDDRLHLNSEGHRRLSLGMASLIGIESEDWLAPLPPVAGPGRLANAAGDLRWAWSFLVPWIGRRLTGRSSGDGRFAKRPELALLDDMP
ncbi:MAG TPA: SGNH/GDSL hydrolase family protein [Solirubrobacterales bacterium]|nr:SGNH/GDSL hydrolase family protein [Solirubrobacterales bacterium]